MGHKVSKWPYTAALQWHQLLELTASEDRSAFPSRACSNSSLVSRQLRMCTPRLVELHARDAVTLWAFKKHPRIPAERLCMDFLSFWHTHNQGVSFLVHWLHALWPCRELCWWLIQSCCAGPQRCDPWWTVLTFLFSSEIRKINTKLDLVSL